MLIAAARIVTGNGSGTAPPARGPAVLSPGYVACADGKIAAVGAGPPPGRADVELADGVLLPGFVDLQVNGYFGVELSEADAAGWEEVVRRLPETGTTAFMPTFITCPLAELTDALRRAAVIAAGLTAGTAGARVLGVHVEG